MKTGGYENFPAKVICIGSEKFRANILNISM